MAELKDVENVFVSTIAQVIYPNGTSQPSLNGRDVRIYRGWPVPGNLNADLASGKVNVSVYSQANERNVTRFPREWQVLSQPTASLTLTVSGQTITVGGTVSSPLNAAVTILGRTYVYAVQPSDTLLSIATALATLIDRDTQATSSGPVIATAYTPTAIVGGVGSMIRELKRQKRGFIVTLWCADPDSRDALAGPLDAALAEIDYLSLPDGSSARLIYEKTIVSDRSERDNLYRLDLFYSVEYATTQTQTAYQIVDVVLNLEDFQGNHLPAHQASLELESGGYMLMEDGSRLLLDYSPAITHQDSVQLESGTYLLTEGGDRLILDYTPPPQVITPPDFDSLQLEAGYYLETESGNRIVLDFGTPAGVMLLENGGNTLLETGYKLLLES